MSDGAGKKVILFKVRDPQGRQVFLEDSTWDHIKLGHPEITTPKRIKDTVTKPSIISQNEQRKSIIYTDFTPGGLYLNVFAKEEDPNTCRVRTAYFTGKTPEGNCIWPQNIHRQKG